ncbi:MAG: hypothetical protein NZ748_01025 [Candidatus Marinimicrobia bacterium]|nr:hypothetical protein [Candidatus Neomarinimicrobiota bacterium]
MLTQSHPLKNPTPIHPIQNILIAIHPDQKLINLTHEINMDKVQPPIIIKIQPPIVIVIDQEIETIHEINHDQKLIHLIHEINQDHGAEAAIKEKIWNREYVNQISTSFSIGVVTIRSYSF